MTFLETKIPIPSAKIPDDLLLESVLLGIATPVESY